MKELRRAISIVAVAAIFAGSPRPLLLVAALAKDKSLLFDRTHGQGRSTIC